LPTDLEADIERMRRPGVHVRSDRDPGLVHIPIRSIVGVSNLHNLTHERGNDFQIATFGDALFEALHGASLIYPDSLDYLCSESVKAKGEMVQRDEMPQVEKISSNDPKYAAMGEMTFQRYGDRYIAFNGKQRTLIAIYAIWQRKGPDGILYNVRIT
jgi:hypothetical protein